MASSQKIINRKLEFAVKLLTFWIKNKWLKTCSYSYSFDYFVVLAYKIFSSYFKPNMSILSKLNLKNQKFKMVAILLP